MLKFLKVSSLYEIENKIIFKMLLKRFCIDLKNLFILRAIILVLFERNTGKYFQI